MKRAQTGAMDTAINRLIGMTGATDGSKKPGNNRAVFGIGLAQFSEASSKHTKLLKRFIKKARALGHICVGIHEYYRTSNRGASSVHNAWFILTEMLSVPRISRGSLIATSYTRPGLQSTCHRNRPQAL